MSTTEAQRISPAKLGLLVAWPAFWTGTPFKMVICLLLLAMGVHPWEMPGVGFLLLLSLPIDLWAVGLSARTVFLERLRIQPQEGLGLSLWGKGMLLSVIYLPLSYFAEKEAIELSKSITEWFLGLWGTIPVAERISIELTLWGSIATVAFLSLCYGWVFLFGRMVKARAVESNPAEASYETVVHQWDNMRVPLDQGLMLTAFSMVGLGLVFILWAAMPVTTPHPHEQYKPSKEPVKVAPLLKPMEVIQKSDKALARADVTLQGLEEKKTEEESKISKEKSKGKAGTKPDAAAAPEAGKPVTLKASPGQ